MAFRIINITPLLHRAPGRNDGGSPAPSSGVWRHRRGLHLAAASRRPDALPGEAERLRDLFLEMRQGLAGSGLRVGILIQKPPMGHGTASESEFTRTINAKGVDDRIGLPACPGLCGTPPPGGGQPSPRPGRNSCWSMTTFAWPTMARTAAIAPRHLAALEQVTGRRFDREGLLAALKTEPALRQQWDAVSAGRACWPSRGRSGRPSMRPIRSCRAVSAFVTPAAWNSSTPTPSRRCWPAATRRLSAPIPPATGPAIRRRCFNRNLLDLRAGAGDEGHSGNPCGVRTLTRTTATTRRLRCSIPKFFFPSCMAAPASSFGSAGRTSSSRPAARPTADAQGAHRRLPETVRPDAPGRVGRVPPRRCRPIPPSFPAGVNYSVRNENWTCAVLAHSGHSGDRWRERLKPRCDADRPRCDLFRDDELKAFLANGLLLDGAAAKRLCERGLGGWLGVAPISPPAGNVPLSG